MKLINTDEGTSATVTKNEICDATVNDWLDMLEGALCGMGYAKYEFLIKDDPDNEDNYIQDVSPEEQRPITLKKKK